VFNGLFGVRWTEKEIAQMNVAATWDAKTPSFEFAADAEGKRREASARVLAAAELVRPLYEELERRRKADLGGLRGILRHATS
jgi:hypothetical protein